ncbi:unnamed protein product [Paramecium pentaurelia]|uniref:Transmembrane protein n=1 Tax=Paramecium pentaurelia TaxID=43138 RepID=A0A8S1WK21_9CILI|nr:unnamed protein product [Paramecium pentaurelia]
MRFRKIKEFRYKRRQNQQLQYIQIPNNQVPHNQNNNIQNYQRQQPSPQNQIQVNSQYSNSIKLNQPQPYITAPNIPQNVPQLLWPYLCLFVFNLGLGIAIFATQGSETAIIIFEVFKMLLNIISGIYYYSKSTETIFNVPQCFKILFCIILTQFFCNFIQLLICWITQVSYSLQLVTIILLIIFLLYFYYQRKRYVKG